MWSTLSKGTPSHGKIPREDMIVVIYAVYMNIYNLSHIYSYIYIYVYITIIIYINVFFFCIGPRSLQNENSLVDVQKFVERLGVSGDIRDIAIVNGGYKPTYDITGEASPCKMCMEASFSFLIPPLYKQTSSHLRSYYPHGP